MRALTAAVMAVFLSAEAHAESSAEIAERRKDIGRTFWIGNDARGVVELCPSTETVQRCVRISNTSFDVTDIAIGYKAPPPHDFAVAFYAVRLPDGRTGYVRLLRRGFFHFVDPAIEERAAATDCEARGEPELGMSRQQVERTCWGKPSRVQKLTTQAGLILLYSTGNSVELHNNKVTAISPHE